MVWMNLVIKSFIVFSTHKMALINHCIRQVEICNICADNVIAGITIYFSRSIFDFFEFIKSGSNQKICAIFSKKTDFPDPPLK